MAWLQRDSFFLEKVAAVSVFHARGNAHNNEGESRLRLGQCAAKALYPLTLAPSHAILPVVDMFPLAEATS